MPAALFLAPHFDDVAFSCGGTFRALATHGWATTLCTVFTRSIAGPTGFALACQLDKGLGPEIDYLALRRAEDDAAAIALGATNLERLDLCEAPHRGYESASALFGAFVPADTVGPEIDALLRSRLEKYDLIFAPQALGEHVDHRRIRDAVLGSARVSALFDRVLWYRDTPYVIRDHDALPAGGIGAAFPSTFAFALDETTLAAKLRACAAYASQLTFQFGGEASMRDSIRALALSESARLGIAGPSEIFQATAAGMAFMRDSAPVFAA